MELVSQRISSLPAVANVDRDVVITGIYVDITEPRLELLYHVKYSIDNEDVSGFQATGARWIVDNSYTVKVMGEDGNPIPNPDYDPEDESSEPFIMKEAFDYFIDISFRAEHPIRIEDLMKLYIIRDDSENKRFDF
jgi:hypothetical protein